MKSSTIPPEAEQVVLTLLERLERARALEPDESHLLAGLINRQCRRARRVAPLKPYWTHRDDALLLRLARRRGGVKAVSERTGRSTAAVRARLLRLRRRQADRDGVKD